jgi:hypothetical protein
VWLEVAVFMVSVGGPPQAKAAETAPVPAAAGTTIVGDEDTAVGLNLSPWKNEPPPDAAPPPALYNDPPSAAGDASFAAAIATRDGIVAYRHARLHGGR